MSNTAIVLAHPEYDEAHLEKVTAEMRELGAPRIRVIKMDDNFYQAIEGCHRLRAAVRLGLTPIFEELDYDQCREMLVPQMEDDGVTIEALCDRMHISPEIIFFGGDGE